MEEYLFVLTDTQTGEEAWKGWRLLVVAKKGAWMACRATGRAMTLYAYNKETWQKEQLARYEWNESLGTVREIMEQRINS